MGKALSNMTLEELWELFLTILTEHQEIWSEWYAEEQRSHDELYFRDYMNRNPLLARQY